MESKSEEMKSNSSQPKESAVTLVSEKMHKELQEILKLKEPEEKLKRSIEFMRAVLSQKGSLRFKDFWDAKKVCLPLFKEKINPAVKSKFWADYIELSEEAKKLRELFEEQASFAEEQIELALSACRKDLQEHQKTSQESDNLLQMQEEIRFFMLLSSRTKSLREEILKTDMRVKRKNKLLENLSKLADEFLPKKNQLIQKVSQLFVDKVDQFISDNFSLEEKKIINNKQPLYAIRNQIKALQAEAKQLSLNSKTFSKCRLKLSECWQLLVEAEKKYRSEKEEREKVFKEQLSEFSKELADLEEKLSAATSLTKNKIVQEMESCQKRLKEKRLPKQEFSKAMKMIHELEEKLLMPFLQKDLEQKKQREEEKQKQLESLKEAFEKAEFYLFGKKEITLKEVETAKDDFLKALKNHKLSFGDSMKASEIKHGLKELKLLCIEKEMDEEDLEDLLQQWEEFREYTRETLESYRKKMGSSGFDLEKAMLYREYIDLEKSRIDRSIVKIEEIQDKL